MKKQNIILFLFLLVGLSILNYPFISQLVNRRSESQAVESYEKQTDILEDEKKRIIKQEAKRITKSFWKNRLVFQTDFLCKVRETTYMKKF